MERILVVLPNWYGETLFATPFLRALRQQRSDAFIATLGWPQCREVLLHSPHVNELIDYDERCAHRGVAGKWRLIVALRARRFDTAFILRKSLSRSLLLASAGILARVGFDHPKSGWLLTRRVSPPAPAPHKAFSYLPLLEAIGLAAARHPYDYTVSAEERLAARALLKTTPLVSGRPMIMLHPGANWRHKRWPPERFAALGDRLAERTQSQIVITGGRDDAALGEAVARRMRQPVAMLAGLTTLRQLGACLEQARLVVAGDTGVLHIAAALHRPVVGLYGPTAPAFTGPLGDPRRTAIIHHADCCPHIPCYAPEHPVHPGMEAIAVDEVYQAAAELLNSVTQ